VLASSETKVDAAIDMMVLAALAASRRRASRWVVMFQTLMALNRIPMIRVKPMPSLALRLNRGRCIGVSAGAADMCPRA